jgi:hypothetical protein
MVHLLLEKTRIAAAGEEALRRGATIAGVQGQQG